MLLVRSSSSLLWSILHGTCEPPKYFLGNKWKINEQRNEDKKTLSRFLSSFPSLSLLSLLCPFASHIDPLQRLTLSFYALLMSSHLLKISSEITSTSPPSPHSILITRNLLPLGSILTYAHIYLCVSSSIALYSFMFTSASI